MAEEPGLDSKELILVVFGILMLVVLLHESWVAWRKSQKNLKFEIADSVAQEDPDDIGLLRGELPNGGARLVEKSQQQNLSFLNLIAPHMQISNSLFPVYHSLFTAPLNHLESLRLK